MTTLLPMPRKPLVELAPGRIAQDGLAARLQVSRRVSAVLARVFAAPGCGAAERPPGGCGAA